MKMMTGKNKLSTEIRTVTGMLPGRLNRIWFGCCLGLLLSAHVAYAGPYDTWAKYKTLTVNTTSATGAANISSTLTNYPLLVRLTTANADDILGEALASGADVRFTSSDGATAYSYQIEYWSATEADIWVLVPSMTGNSTPGLRVYWKKAGQSDASSASTVFATSNSFVGVWHLNDASSTSASNYKDATANGYNGTSGSSAPGSVTGAIGSGTSFANTNTSYIDFGTTPGSSAIQTVSFWYKTTDGTLYQTPVDKLPATGTSGWNLKIRRATDTPNNEIWNRVGSEGTQSDAKASNAYTVNSFAYATLTYTGGTQKLYVNGSLITTKTSVTNTVNNSTTNLRFGYPSVVGTEGFLGTLDEVEISNVDRGADWITLNYQTQKSGATCTSYGPTVSNTYYWNRNAQVSSSTDFSKAFNWTTNADSTGRMPVSSADDDFTSDTKDAAWTMYDADGYTDSPNPYYSLTDSIDKFTLRAAGADVYGPNNQFVAAYRTDITGDFDVQVKILSQTNTDQSAKTGIMMANNIGTLTNGGFATVFVTPTHNFNFQYNTSGTQGQLNGGNEAGSTTYPCWLRLVKSGTSVTAWYKTASNNAWGQIGSAQTGIMNLSSGGNSQIGLFVTAHTATTGPVSTVVFDEFQGGSTLSSGQALSFGGTGSNADANATLSANQSAASVDFTGYTGTFNFGSYTLTLNTGDATFVSGMTVTAGTGTLAFTGNSGTQTFTPKSGATFPAITKSGASGIVAVATNALTAGAYTLTSGEWDWGTGLTHSVTSISTSAGTMNFDSSTVQVTSGNANLSSLGTVVPGTGTLALTGTSGTQVLTPPSGISLPSVAKSGAGIMQLSTNTLNCLSYSQSAGTVDFNSQNVTTTGNFTLTSGTASSFNNLTGRTLTIGGNASFTGSAGNLVNLNQGAWTITVAGTLTADYATIYGSNASGGSMGVATHSYNAKSNTNWLFSVPATLSNLTKSVRLNFNTTNSGGGANVSGNVTNFPLFLRFTSSNLTFSATSDSGSDLIFVDKDGTTLNHQVVEWDKANQTGKVWVRVPQVDGNSTTDYITLYYGCDSCTTNSYARSDSVFGVFKSVFHLNAPEAKAYDATTLANHGTFVSNLPNLANGGIVSKNAAVFDGSANSYIDIPNESNYDLTTNISVWAWIKVGSFTSNYQAIVAKGNNTFRLLRHNNTNFLFFSCTKSASTFQVGGSVSVNDGNWHLVVGTYDGSNVKLYVDSAQDGASTALTGSIDVNNSDVYIGENAGNTGTVFNGDISEVRIGNTAAALSSDFIKLSYKTQIANSTFLTAFTTASFQNTKVFKLNTTASGANIAANVTNFPLLLRITGGGITAAVQGTGTNAPADIRFLDGDGVTWLDYQVERWDRSLDSAEVWVRVPTIEGNYNGHTITMYYKQASGVTLVDGQCASCVFQTSNNFVADWHFNTSGTGSRPDATSNALSLTTGNYAGSELKGGVIAGADSLNGTNQYLQAPSGFSDWSTGLTYTGWAYWASTSSFSRLIDFGTGIHSENIWTGRNTTTTTWTTELWNGTTSGGYTSAATALATGAWAHFAVTVNGTAVKMYKNGALVQSGTSSQSLKVITRTSNFLGRSNWGDPYFQGKFDEVAFANTTRDSNWIKLCYQNQRNDASPLFNPSPADFRSTRKLVFNTTKTGANVSNNVTNYPLLVRLSAANGGFIDSVQNNAPDIRFLDGDGTTWLNYVVERWDKTVDSAEVWVMVPQVDGNSDHDFITMYYAQASGVTVPDGHCTSCVFGNYKMVYHLSESPGNGAPQFGDSTGNANSGTAQAGVAGDQVSANSGKGFNLNGSTKYLSTTTSFVNPTTLTNSVWFKTANAYGSGGSILNFGSSQTGSSFGHDRHIWMLNNGKLVFGVYYSLTGYEITSSSAYNDGNWHQAAVRLSNGTYSGMYLFIDGAQAGYLSNTNVDNITGYWRAGYDNTGGWTSSGSVTSSFFNGTIDEVRIAHSELSNDVIKLDYETQRRTGNLFWNSRSGPNNKATLTATATSSSNIALSWSSTVSDSSNADSVGIWVKYSAYPDSVGTGGGTFVAKLAKTDTAYSYPATYPTTYYFALAVRNTSGQWSPFTSSSSDSATLSGVTMPDTVYVDSAIGNNSNTCAQAQSPATPRLTVTSALTCGGSASDTLVVRVMPGTYASDNAFAITTKPSIVTSFDNTTRAVLAGNGSVAENSLTWNYAVSLSTDMILRNMDVRANATTDKHIGIYVRSDADTIDIVGNRIYGSGSYAFDTSITIPSTNCERMLVANNLIYKPNKYGVRLGTDDNTNVMHNVFIGPGSGTTKGLYLTNASWDAGWYNLTNNIFYNWSTGIETVDADNEVGNVSNNLFWLVTTGQEVVKETDANKILKDPLFANTTIGNPNAFKLLPGSPAIDAGTSTVLTTSYSNNHFASADYFGNSRTIGSAPDIGLYEGTGYTPNPSGEFDTLTVSSTATTVTVQNSKWKLVWDQARGAGITQFYDKVTSSANLLASNSLLFDAKIDSYTASSQTTTGPILSLIENTRARAVVRQRLPVSASLDLNIYYSVYSSGHVYIESELSNLAASSTAVGTVDYTLKLGTTTAAYTSAGTKNGFGYLTTSSRGAVLSVTRNLDGGASGAETWATSTAASGSPGTVVFNTTDLANLSQNTVRRHDFLLYVGDNSLTFDKVAAINADAYTPSALSMSAGSLIGERSWQEILQGHWTMDDGAGTTARDKSVNNLNNATVGGANYKWVTGKVGGGLYLTTTDSAYVASASVLNPANAFTVMFWLKPDFANMGDTALILSKGLSNANGWYCRKVTAVNKVQFTMGAATVTSPTLTDAVWTHIAVVADAGNNQQLEMYINGVQAAASTASATATSNTANLVFGYASGSIANAKFKGTLDDVRIYGRELPGNDVQSIYDFGFSSRYGQYAVRADNNNRVVALINGGAAQTRVQPAFFISNWFGPRNPKYVFLNGSKLTPNVDYVVDSVSHAPFGSYLTFQLNKILTGADQTLFIDDDDSTGFMGTASAMKSLTITATASDKIVVKNFSDTVFGGAASGQWYMELGLKGWTDPLATASITKDSSFGEIKAWKAAAVSPNVAISSAYQMVGFSYKTGRALSYMKLDARTNEVFTGGKGYLSPAALSYSLVDSSSTRLSLTLSAISLSGTAGTSTLVKRFTFYPTGRVFVSYVISSQTDDFLAPRLDLNPRYDGLNPDTAWSTTTATSSARWALIGGDLNFHPIGLAILSVKNNISSYTTAASLVSSTFNLTQLGSSNDQNALQFTMPTSLWTSANKPVTINYMMDFSKKFADSATADSLLKDSQTPAVLTAITGSRDTSDALDFNHDNFAEGDGAYTYTASSGIAHFRFVNTVTSFYPAFRIKSWTQGTLPDFVVLDNQVLTKGYHYNAYLNTATNEVVMQFNKTLAPGTHVFFISQKSGLAVTLRRFEAQSGEGVDSLLWTTESEFQNLGYNVYRRVVPASESADSTTALSGTASQPAQAAAKNTSSAQVTVPAANGNPADTLPSVKLTPQELKALGYEKLNPKLIPGGPGGASATTREYQYLDRSAVFGTTYQYVLESVDFNGALAQFGPRTAKPFNPLVTELYSNYPNPFNPITTLRFSLHDKLKVSLIIYDVRGRVVRTLLRPDKPMAPGKYRLIWDARSDGGFEVPSGQYFYRFTAERYTRTRKMVMVK